MSYFQEPRDAVSQKYFPLGPYLIAITGGPLIEKIVSWPTEKCGLTKGYLRKIFIRFGMLINCIWSPYYKNSSVDQMDFWKLTHSSSWPNAVLTKSSQIFCRNLITVSVEIAVVQFLDPKSPKLTKHFEKFNHQSTTRFPVGITFWVRFVILINCIRST